MAQRFGRSQRRRFRWSRAKYREAHREARIYYGVGFMHHSEPSLVRRYRELWEEHPQGDDPLLTPLRWRHPGDEVPF